MKHQKLFNDTLGSLGIKNIYIDKFTPEQIYYQLETAAGAQIDSLEQEINASHKRYIKKKKLAEEAADMTTRDQSAGEASASTEGADASNNGREERSSDATYSETAEMSDDDEASVTGTDASEIASASDYSNEDGSSEEFSYSSEDEEELKDVDWDASGSSYDEVLNQPAELTLKMLNSKSNNDNQGENK